MAIYSRIHNGKKQWRFRTYYNAIDGSRKQKNSKWFDTKKEARDQEAIFIQFKTVGASNVTFEDVVIKWTSHNEKTLKPTTLRTKKTILNWLQPFYPKKIEKITSLDIDNFFESNNIKKKTYKTKCTILANLKVIFKFAKVHYGVQNNPFLKMTPLKKPIATEAEQVEILLKDDFFKIFNFLKQYKNGKYDEEANILWTLYFTGMRVGECLSLTFNDFDGKTVHVNKQLQRGDWMTPKTKSSIRKITLDPKTINIIQSQFNKYKEYPRFTKDWFIFGGYKQFSETSLRYHKNIACRELNIKEFKIHSLRHSHASNLIEAGVNIFKISKRLGHSSIKMTMDIYGHIIDVNETEIINAISSFF